MLRNISFHLLFVLTIASLLYLGFWQLDRLLWKTELLNNIKNQQNEEPIPFPFSENSNTHDFKRSEITGVFIPDTEMYFFRSNLKGESGFSVLTAFQTKLSKIVYIDIGWIPFKEKDLKKIEIIKDKKFDNNEQEKFKTLFGMNSLNKMKTFLSNTNSSELENAISKRINASKVELKKLIPVTFDDELTKLKSNVNKFF